MFAWVLKKMFGSKNERELRRLAPRVDAINALEAEWKKLSDDALREKTAEFRRQLDKGAPLDDLIAPAFATVREGSRRVLGMRHYDVQLIGGMVLHEGKVAEMRTGEGKTLVATLPVYLNALEGRGVHVVTVNDYLAGRDAEWMGRLYGFLGMSTGVIRPRQSPEQKKRAYGCDVTYGQNNEFGFDYLRDNMKFSIHEYAQRELRYAIVDEVDSILIDEARTPLIISGQGSSASQKYVQIDEIIPRLRKDEHFEVDEKARSCSLTEEGVEYAQKLLTDKGLLEVMPGRRVGNLYDPTNLETLHIMQQCLRAHALYHRDKQYMVGPDQKVLIIDEHTGRTLPGRRWSDGLHQAVEAKERVAIEEESITLATISFQNLFRLYHKLSGMTGTAETEASEFHQIYKLDVLTIPTNKAISRKDAEDLVYKTEREKFKAIVEEIKDARTKGQPVLVGTTSVEKSDALASQLARAGVPHNVLNAKQHEREAYVVAQAGMRGAVTVATNMAGRGTDILLGGNPEMLARLEVMQKLTPEEAANKAVFDAAIVDATKHYVDHCKEEGKAIRAAGGLRIIGTERHESRRIDNQLRGRAGRQGDPGESRFYLSLEDDLMRIFAGDRVQMMMDRLGMEEDVPIEHEWVTRAVENAQKKVEERNFDIRKHLLEYDDVMNQQRKGVYALRRQVLCGQYRSVPTDEEAKAGKLPEPRVQKADEKLAARVKPILEQMVKLHAAEPPAADATNDEVLAFRDRALAASILSLTNVRYLSVERDVYTWFGCVVELRKFANEPKKLLEVLEAEVALSLTEQRERMLDLVDEMIGGMVAKHCPKDAHWEDWDREGLARTYAAQFQIPCRPLDKAIDAQTITEQLYADAEAVLLRKEKDFGPENLLRLFRNIYLEEIDRQWIDHLQSMDNLRDGINLRAFGQRDPKKEFKREGFFMFQNMMATITSSVAEATFSLKHASEEDMQRLEAQRRRDAEIRAGGAGAHPATAQAQAEAAAAAAEAARALSGGARVSSPAASPGARTSLPAEQPKPLPVRREAPKIGRNDPCYCGSGKKYKACHYREDQSASGR